MVDKKALEALDAALADEQPIAEQETSDLDAVPEFEPDDLPGLEIEEVPVDEEVAEETAEADTDEPVPDDTDVPDEQEPEESEEADGDAAEAEEEAEDVKDDAGEGEAEPAEDEAEKEAKPSDEFGELPENTPKRTQERFQSLKGKYDELDSQLKVAQEQNEEWAGHLQRVGANGEQLGLVFEYLGAVNSNTPEGLEKAYQFMQNELAVLGRALGKEAPGFDPMAEHADLQQEYERGEITKERAAEIIQARQAANLQQQNQSMQTQQQEAEAKKRAGLDGLSKLHVELAADAQWEMKKELLTPLVKGIVSTADPSQWADLVREAYQKIPDMAPPKPKLAPAPNPVRPTGPTAGEGGGVTKEPGNIYEALDMSLGI